MGSDSAITTMEGATCAAGLAVRMNRGQVGILDGEILYRDILYLNPRGKMERV